MKCFGAILVIFSCGGFGFAMAAAYRREEKQLRQLSDILLYLSAQHQYRLISLPDLCSTVAKQGSGAIFRVFSELGRQLSSGTEWDVCQCLLAAARKEDLTPSVRELLHGLGNTLGQFDLTGQLEALTDLRSQCGEVLHRLSLGREDRLRSYQTLGICAGTALVILFV